ncbi:OB-fold domain-containing protein [Streptomyces sp. NPDC058001]|uniref:OB-fold nucleic acid binding domain-containing protein n=1 Tax=Streptomyces sp. NPDC058001 TaxID=3346300 RepID=UPI0036E0592C
MSTTHKATRSTNDTAETVGTMDWMAAQITMPYTLTPGRATGIFLAELAGRRLIGSRHGDEIIVPAQDYSGSTGEPASDFVEVPPVGTIQAFTTTADGTIALVLVDGSTVPFTHRLLGFEPGVMVVGSRVEAVWADEPTGGMLDLAGFGPLGAAESFEPRPDPAELAAPSERIDYTMTLDYRHAYGPYYGTLFDGIKDGRRIRGVRCSECRRLLLPPRAHCDVCFAPTAEWVDVEATGTVQASSVVHIEFIGQRLKPPYVYAEIVLDGTSTRLIHMVGGVDAEEARTAVAPGARVRAVWSDRHTGSLADIDHFELAPEETP